MLTNKYAEGYPGKRYYGGNAVIDDVEALAIDRVKRLFGADHANVQPHSGANANMCAYQALLEPGDTVLGLSLDHGGHLTHGSPVNASGMLYHFVPYKVTPGDERIDMDQVRDLALEHRPKMIVAGTTSYPRRLDPEPFRAIADEVGALFLFDAAHLAGLIAGGAHPNPVPYADIVTFTTHKTLRGPRGGCILSQGRARRGDRQGGLPRLAGRPARARHRRQGGGLPRGAAPELHRVRHSRSCANASALAAALGGQGFRLGQRRHRQPPDGGRPARRSTPTSPARRPRAVLDEAGITLNKNTIPDDPRSPFVTSGVRIGTPSVTTQGMKEPEMADHRRLHRPGAARTAATPTELAAVRVRGRCALRRSSPPTADR